MSEKTGDKKRIIVALDYDNADAALDLLGQLDSNTCRVKIGKQLFTACGPELVRQVIDRGFEVFLDLKFHDIPNTVAGAVSAAADLGVWMVNLHACGGRAMMEAAADTLSRRSGTSPLLIGVTVLTSMSAMDLNEVGVSATPAQQVENLAQLAINCGLDGMVCSAKETTLLRSMFGPSVCLVTPGIRREEDSHGDQKRVLGPAEAISAGSSYLVVGRPITGADSPGHSLAAFNQAVSGVI